MLMEITSFIFLKKKINNMVLYHAYTVLEFSLYSLFFIKTITFRGTAVFIFVLLFLFFGIAIFEFLKGSDVLNDLSTTVESILLIVYSIIAFYWLLQHPAQARIVAVPLFWQNTAILLYFSGNLFLFIFSNYIERHSNKVYYELWGIHSVLNIIFYLLISTGFWKTKAR